MITPREHLEKAISQIDGEEAANLLMDLINIPSPTGREGAVGEYILDWFQRNGFVTIRQEVDQGRYNAVGILPGSGGGLSLMFNGHMDTVVPHTLDHLWYLLGAERPEEQFKPQASREGDHIFGDGAVNAKGCITAFLTAALALKKSGVALKGDGIFAPVVGEIERVPIGPYQGPAYRGEGWGTRFLLTHGVQSDYAIVAEPTGLCISWAMPGLAFLRISTYGQAKYTPYTQRSLSPQDSDNAVVRMIPVIQALEKWAVEYEETNHYPFAGGVIKPKVSIGAITGGVPYKPNYSPGVCSIYLDVRVPPSRTPFSIAAEVREVVDKLGLGASVQLYLSQNGYEGQHSMPLVRVVEDAHGHLFGEKPPQIPSDVTSSWNDVNVYHEMGLRAIKCGPAPRLFPQTFWDREAISIQELVDAAKLYVACVLEVCNRQKLE